MKKKVFSLMMMLLLTVTGFVRAQELTVHDGTTTNSYVPFYGLYVDDYTRSEMLYPAAELAEMTGATINSLTFYKNSTSTSSWGAASFQIYMKEVSNTTLSAYIGMTDATIVYEGGINAAGGEIEVTINFTTPYTYNGGNLLIGVYQTVRGTYSSAYWYGEAVTGASGTGYNSSSAASASFSQRNFLPKTTFEYTGGNGGGSGSANQVIFAMQDGDQVDVIHVGSRPNGCWMEPFTFQLTNDGGATTVNLIDFTPNDYFTVVNELPFALANGAEEDIQLTTGNANGNTAWQMVVIYGEGRTAEVFDIDAEPYDPAVPDVWEWACEDATSFPFVEQPAQVHNTTLHNDYNLPFPEIEEGYDAVYKLVFPNDMSLNAEVTQGDNAKVALYTEDFNGEGGPMATNNYNGPMNAGGAGAPFEAQIGEGTSTFGYFPFYTLYNYSIAENLFLATELAEAGVSTAPMTSLSWYATNQTGNAQQGITIWMANVEDAALTTTSHITTGMTKVYTGTMTPVVGWNEFVFNEDAFAWDGHSNVLIFCQRNNGSWNSTISWQATTSLPFTCSAYKYQDSGAYDVTVGNAMTTSTTRPNIIMKATGRATSTPAPAQISYGPVITDAPVAAGTYYLVASSTDSNFVVNINADLMPCPELDGFAFGEMPADDEDEVEPASVTLQWTNPANATKYQVYFGSTYYPQPNHPQTEISEVMDVTGPTGSYTVRNLWNNTNYFWYVVFYNDGACDDGVEGPHWGFTTHLNIPQNLRANDETIFNDETVTLTWNAVVDRTYRFYNVYRDGVLIGSTQTNNIGATTYTDGPLAYNMGGYTYYVTAVYDEGESAPSNTVNVKVSGYGNVTGHVYEQDYAELGANATPIAGATVKMVGTDEFGDSHTYTATSNAQGAYNFHIYAGEYNGTATCDGYQGPVEPVQGNPVGVTYNQTTSPVDYVLDENFDPVCQVIAEYYPDSLDPESPYVKVYWGCGLPGSDIIEDFETGDFSMFDWQVSSSNPWTISTTNPYEGTYCMKSGGAGVANVESIMSVTVDIPADGLMSFFGKISSESNYDYGKFYIDGVEKGSWSGAGSWAERTYDITEGSHTFKWTYKKDGSVNSNEDCFYVDYITFYKQPAPPVAGNSYNFETGLEGWTSIDADGDGYGWMLASDVMGTGYGHNGSDDCVLSQSYSNSVGVLYPNNYLVSPLVQLGGTLTFYACAQDASYAAEHFGVAVSTTSNTNASAFTMLQEWTMTAKKVDNYKSANVDATADTPMKGHSRGGNTRAQGNWYQYTVDLGQYAGQTGYVAIRHFNCSDMFYLDVDDITISEPAKSANNRSFQYYRVYRTDCYNDGPYTLLDEDHPDGNTRVLACELHDTIYIDVDWPDAAPGVYKWGVGCVYAGNRGELYETPIQWTAPAAVNPDRSRADVPITFNMQDSWGDGWNGGYIQVAVNGANTEQVTLSSGSSGTQTINVAEGSHVSLTWVSGNWDSEVSFQVIMNNATIYSVSSPVAGLLYEFDATLNGGGGGGNNNNSGSYGPGLEPVQETDRESVIVWSNCLDKGMYLADGEVTVNVLLNSADSPEGVRVSFTNLNEAEQELYPVADVVLDETGYYAYESFRKGEYRVKVEFAGYETIEEDVSIWEPTDLRYVMVEIIYGVDNLYVSSTGWAMWDAQGAAPTGGQGGGQGGNGSTFEVGFDGNTLPEGWTVIDGNNDGWTWCLTSAIPTTWTYYASLTLDWYHSGSNAICSGSYINGVGALNPDEYLVSPQVTLGAGSQLSFWVAATDASYPADHFGVFVSDNGTSDWTSVQEWTLTAKKEGMAGGSASRDGNGLRLGTWYNYTVDLSAYAGQKYVAFRHFNCYDQYIMCLDDIELTTGAKSDERHLEYFKVMCTSTDGEPIFNANTEHNFCQVETESLEAGEHYICKVAAMYSTGMSDWSEVEWQYIPCTEYAGPVNDEITIEGNVISWEYPGGNGGGQGGGTGDTFTESWDNGLNGWTNIDGDGDGHMWYHSSEAGNHSTAAVTSHSGAGHLMGESYCNATWAALTPNDFIVSPQMYAIANGSVFSFWACTQDVSYPSEHFGVAVSTTGNTSAADFTTLSEWTITAKGEGNPTKAGRDNRESREGNWYQYTCDLSAYAGQNVWIAIRHFGCTDMFIVNIDDAELTAGAKSNRNPWDLMMTFTAPEGGHYGVAYDGNNFYTSNWGYSSAAHNFYKYDLQGNMLEGFEISGCGTLRGMTYDGEHFYGVANSSTVYCVDLANHSVVSTFTSAYGAMRGITYDPERDGFWVIGNWSGNLTLIDRTGAIVTTGPAPTSASDLAYYKDENDVEHIFCFNNSTNEVVDWVIGNPSMGSAVFNFSNVPGYASGSSGGCTVGSFNGKIAFMGDIQQSPNLIGVYELRDDDTPVQPVNPDADIIGAMIFADGEWVAQVDYPANTYEYEGDAEEVCVRIIYDGTNITPEGNIYFSMSCPVCESFEPAPETCDAGAPIHAEVLGATDQVRVWWGEEPAAPMSEWLSYFDENATQISPIGANGSDVYWGMMVPADMLTPYVGTSLTKIALYQIAQYNSADVTVNIFLGGTTAPQTLVSTMTYTPSVFDDFEEVTLTTPVPVDGTQNLWITVKEYGTYPAMGVASLGNANARWISLDGVVWEDVATYNLNYDWLIMGYVTNEGKGGEVTPIEFTAGVAPANSTLAKAEEVSAHLSFMTRDEIVKYNVYRSDDANGGYVLIGEVAEDGSGFYEYIDTPEVGTYYYQVTAVYEGGCESDPAASAENPDENYVSAIVTGLSEDGGNVALYPNPTKGNVTVEAAGMNRITVVSVLGQVVFDTEVSADNYTLNMSQFNAGMYMVRVYTAEGVTVKRVTVMQ